MSRVLPLVLLALICVTLVLAVNDPGHDSLYIEQTGDSLLNGSLNITDEQRVENLLYSANLHIVGNGTVLGSPTQPRIMGASSALYIDSTGNLYLNTKGGTTGIVQLGSVTTQAIYLNVSGNVTISHHLRLTNGDLIMGGTPRITDAGVGTFASGTTIAGQAVCLSTGTNCPAGALGGVQNLQQVTNNGSSTTNNISIDTGGIGTTHIGGNLSVDGTTLKVNAANNRVGIGTNTPSNTLEVIGTINATAVQVNNVNVCLSNGTDCQTNAGNVNYGGGWTNTSGSGNISLTNANVNISAKTLFIDNTNGRVGVNNTSPRQQLSIQGDSNITGNLYVVGSLVFGAGNGAGNIGNVTGTGIVNYLPLWTTTTELTTSIMTEINGVVKITGNLNVSSSITVNTNITYVNPSNANSTKEIWKDSNGVVKVERYWNGTHLVLNVSG